VDTLQKVRFFITKDRLSELDINKPMRRKEGVKFFQAHADDLGTPFIEIDKSVCEYADKFGDAQTNSSFRRMVKRDGELAAVFPFELFQHSYSIGVGLAPFDVDKEKLKNDAIRQSLHDILQRVNLLVDRSNAKAVLKGEHYSRALNTQLELCDKMDEDLDLMNAPIYLLRERRNKAL